MQPLICKLGTSYIKCRLIGGVHLLALFACWFNGLDLLWQMLLSILLLTSFVMHLAHERRCTPVSICYTDKNEWYVLEKDMKRTKVVISPNTVVTRWLIIVYVVAQKKHWVVPVFRDAVTADIFRRLQVALRVSIN